MEKIAVPTLLCGTEVWTLTKSDCNPIQAADINVLRSIAVCALIDDEGNGDIKKELNVFSVTKCKEYHAK